MLSKPKPSESKFRFMGPMADGAFVPTNARERITNPSSGPIAWSASATPSWLTVTPSSGTLGAGAHVDVTVAIDEAAAGDLEIGIYDGSVTILDVTNNAAGAAIKASLRVLTSADGGARSPRPLSTRAAARRARIRRG